MVKLRKILKTIIVFECVQWKGGISRGNVKQNFKRSCLNLGMVIAIVVPLGIFFVSLYDGGI